MKSIIQSKKECFVCGCQSGLEDHHIFFGNSNRKQSEKYGCKVWLCYEHHRTGKDAVHRNRKSDLCLKKLAQEVTMSRYGMTTEEFISIFGKSYI